MSAAPAIVADEDVVDVDALHQQLRDYRRALEAIRDTAQETLSALDSMPDRPMVRRNAAVGPLLTLSGLAETALEP